MVEAIQEDKDVAVYLAHALYLTPEQFTPGIADTFASVLAFHRENVERRVGERTKAVEDALRNLVALLANTGFHNSIEMAAARKLLAQEPTS